ncbi:hypothetical protein M408DRAFT_334114, partial [Serendipita vermifera MAFF 305830]
MNTLLRCSHAPSAFAGPSKTRASQHLAGVSSTKRQKIATSATRHSYVGSTPIPVPAGITLERVVLSNSISATTSGTKSRKGDSSGAEERLIIRGQNGETSIKVYNFMRFLLPNAPKPSPTPEEEASQLLGKAPREMKVKRRNPPCPPAAIAQPFSFTPAPAETTLPNQDGSAAPAAVTLFVESPEEKQQRMAWGLTRTLIANAIQGQSEGYTLPIYLIGVGYRAALEADKADPEFSASGSAAGSISPTSPTVVATEVGSTTSNETYPRRRLVMRLGYSHVIYVPVPPDLKVSVPSPTIILVWGRDKQRVGQFCADVRALRKPEVYKGKGVFVGDEKIKMKVGK